MGGPCSDELLSSLVINIRQACEQNIKFKDFISVSGLICFDVDGSTQQCFVISELLCKKSAGEGHSSHLKTLDWNEIDGNGSFVCSMRNKWSSNNENEQCKDPTDVPTGGQSSNYASLNAKLDWSNRTFTLKPPESGSNSEATSALPERNISTLTITVSKGSLKSSSSMSRRDVCNTKLKVNSRSKKFRQNSFRGKRHLHNCYPALPKTPVKKKRPYHQENVAEKHADLFDSADVLSCNRENFQSHKELYNSPDEKPTALSWFEAMISPSSSIESIDSIQPFYLVPHSEPALNFQNEKNIPLPHGNLDQAGLPGNNASYSQQTLEKKDATLSFKPNSPVVSKTACNSASNGTLKTVSSIEHEGLELAKKRSPDNHIMVIGDREHTSHLRSTDTQNTGGQIRCESSASSKKRASLLKWMGLFKKGPKSDTDEKHFPTTQSDVETNKQKGRIGSVPVREPPIEIRVKRWH